MEKELRTLLARLTSAYETMKKISDWRALRSLKDIDAINAIVARRGEVLAEIQLLAAQLPQDKETLPASLVSQYEKLRLLVEEIAAEDRNFMDQVRKRMREIQEELTAQYFMKKHVLSSYRKQQYAFSA
ncbi:MAG: hypothetical protein A2487_10380 [Candidatus Raymondbacteria bacterium RifOxyC12_full_50_8]|uniref:Flagellar protein FliT n=1 Tax=Candidatus Raymondbacteria bacterium RIFOXYD12_FULL_49_13 TaxID=1817890 RepID=A0A1F7FI97_UNCRA|nr:MAG: hypothetical protein A2248_21460 [Candidatus Raymondbacteria bacterium RIFOXYA2_FULL_49_16]OGJ94699.1 MAG: hypothetical protein A2350_08565 [Candidatus Raymondbacteria bacterium RifOxyB12_full_50_8]OGK01280.1 MAG: hypothetical protein A2487_10380 [Candidatus Raymondbacteria bacterium RifOxyC12_full_50_8]OGK06353.1 MAG: hypothetical protein A2519_08780 [Candidatus Raymondbacteria bacterium RIFOXYD12_FULL_49_13]OGP40687.1 MAG: hypothetical protein A2324_03530 [Candidatus Raymondbacteria b